MVHRAWSRLVIVVLALLVGRAPAQEGRPPTVRIAIVLDGEIENLAVGVETLEDEIRRQTRGKFDVAFPSELRVTGDWNRASVEALIDGLFARPDVDLVIAFGPIGSNDVAHRRNLPVPAVAMRIVDAELQGVPFQGPGSGVRNLNYLSAPVNLTRDVLGFREVVSFDRLAVLVPEWLEDALPGLVTGLVSELGDIGVDYRRVPVGYSAGEALAALPDDVEAVIVAPLIHMDPEEFERLIAGLIERRLPSFSLLGVDEVERGIFACLAPETDLERVMKRCAQNVPRILAGEDAGTLPTAITGRERLTINIRTARAIGVWPRFEVLTEAELVGEANVESERRLSLGGVMREALLANRSYLASRESLLVSEENVVQARSLLYPQVGLGASWTQIDEDQAVLGRAERTLAAGISGSQILWSESTWANLDVEELVLASRELDHRTLELDVVLSAAVAYLDVLRAETLERVAVEDLKLTRSNLELAQVRRDLGVGGPAEVYRWESRIATRRQDVLDARAARRVAEIELNRVLHAPLEQPFETVEVGLDDPGIRIDARVGRFIDNPFTFEVFRDFQVDQGLAAAPELASFQEAIRAQERILQSTESSHWQPTFALEGRIDDVIAAEGEGSTIPPPPPGFVSLIPDPEQTTWSAGLIGSFDLLTGGTKRSLERQARHELIRLRLDEEAVRERVEQRIRSSLHVATASYAGIGLSRDAAEASAKNLELVTDSYSRGVVSIIDLLDAQNAALVAEQAAANAIYDFVIDLMEVQRSVGRFDVFSSEAARDAWFRKLDSRLEEHESANGRP